MPDADTREPEVALGESWVARALEGVPVGDVPRQTIADYEGGRVCVNAVACSDPGELWLWFSAAAAKRASLSGHRLAPLVASGQFEGGLYSAYGLGEAIPLAAYREQGELSTEQILQFLWAIARGIDESVRAGLQPVEVSPESLFVDPQRGALLADLGLAREVLGNPPAAIDVNAAWVAPEILRGHGADQRSAVYSFGALAFNLLTGAAPHQGHPDQIAAAGPPSVREVRPDLPEGLDVVIATAMASDPRHRYRSASEARGLAQVVLQERLATETAAPRERHNLHLPWHRDHEDQDWRPGPDAYRPAPEPEPRRRSITSRTHGRKEARAAERERERLAKAAERAAALEAEREADARAEADREARRARRREAERRAIAEREATATAEREAWEQRETEAKAKREAETRVNAEREAAAEAEREAEARAEAEREAAAKTGRLAKQKRDADLEAKRVAEARAKAEREAAGEAKPLDAKQNGAGAAQPAPRSSGRRARMLPLLLLGGALAVGVTAGALIAGSDPPPAPEPFRVASADLGVQVPGDWRGSTSAAGTLSAHPEGDPGSGLTLERVDAPVETSEQASPVRLGAIEAWRDTGAPSEGARAAVTYVIPTATGKLVATCRASNQAAPGTLSECERALSTLRLPAATNLPLADVVAQQEAWQAAVTALGEQRVQPRRNLARAERPAGQELSAQALARVHERAAARFAALPGGDDLAAAARRTAAAYTALARTAGTTSTQRWRAAVERVRRSEDALREAIAAA